MSSSKPTLPESGIDTRVEVSTSDLVVDRSSGKTQTATPSEIGSTIGNYRVIDLLGVGGMAQVFLAEHVEIGRRVALKKLLPEYSVNSEVVERFFQEARAVNRIHHSNIIQVTDFIRTEDGQACYIMELLEGQSLRALIDREAPLSPARTIAIAAQMADALASVHEADIVHRDLKPTNVFLVRLGELPDFVKLLDFGVSKVRPAGAADLLRNSRLTQSGTILGTPAYMAPEQAMGKEVDARTDIYSLGVILYEMLTGKNPFLGSSAFVVLSHQLSLIPDRPSAHVVDLLPGALELDVVVARCLEKDPAERYPSMRAVSETLEEIKRQIAAQAGASIDPALSGVDRLLSLRPSSPPATAAARLRSPRRRTALALGLTLAFSVIAIAGYAALHKPSNVAEGSRSPAVAAPSTPAVAPQRMVFLTTTPPGAEVLEPGNGIPVGVTPLTIGFSNEASTVTLTFRLDGYVPISRAIDPAHEPQVTVELTKIPPRAPLPDKKGKKAASRSRVGSQDATLNPF